MTFGVVSDRQAAVTACRDALLAVTPLTAIGIGGAAGTVGVSVTSVIRSSCLGRALGSENTVCIPRLPRFTLILIPNTFYPWASISTERFISESFAIWRFVYKNIIKEYARKSTKYIH